jgi:hypothetical protein
MKIIHNRYKQTLQAYNNQACIDPMKLERTKELVKKWARILAPTIDQNPTKVFLIEPQEKCLPSSYKQTKPVSYDYLWRRFEK